jgi:hypothetical protein
LEEIFVLTSDTCVHKFLNNLLGLLEVEIAANKMHGLLNSVVHCCKDGEVGGTKMRLLYVNKPSTTPPLGIHGTVSMLSTMLGLGWVI